VAQESGSPKHHGKAGGNVVDITVTRQPENEETATMQEDKEDESKQREGKPNKPADVRRAVEDISAIGVRYDKWPLPRGLDFPTSRMVHQLEILRNTLELRKVKSERAAEEEWTEKPQQLDVRQDQLEAEVVETRKKLADIEANTEEKERQKRQRAKECLLRIPFPSLPLTP
jgi:hypothetical protein